MRHTPAKRLLFSFAAAILAIGAVEVFLHAAARVSPTVDLLLLAPEVQTRPDKILGVRPHPALPGHDRNGFRNAEVPDKVDAVALGDSHTYGSGVSADQAWPRRLERSTGARVYSMAFGGYGPVHSLSLYDEAVKLEPKTIVHGFYAGNDYYDSYNIVYDRGIMPELKTSDADVLKQIDDAEEKEPIADRVKRIFNSGETVAEPSPFRRFLSDYSKIYGLLRRVTFQIGAPSAQAGAAQSEISEDEVWQRAVAYADAHPEYCEKFNDGKFRTIFTSEYRLAGVNLDDPRISEGLRISLLAIKFLSDRARESNIRYVVLLIPSRENVFAELWKAPTANFRLLVKHEEESRRIAKKFLTNNGIEYIDAMPVLRAQFDDGRQPYFVSQDGHPSSVGHEAIARQVALKLGLEAITESPAR